MAGLCDLWEKCKTMAISLAALAAIGSLAATGIGAANSASANAEARERLEREAAEDRRYYDRLLSRDYVNSPENAGLLRRLQELQRERYNQARATNVVAGGTDAHLAAMQAQGNDIVTRTAQGIAERSTAYKDNVAERKRASSRAHTQQMFGLDQQKAQTIANAAGQASKAMAGIAGAAGSAQNPYDVFGLTQGDYETLAQANIDANTEAAVQQQLADSLQNTLDDLKRKGY